MRTRSALETAKRPVAGLFCFSFLLLFFSCCLSLFLLFVSFGLLFSFWFSLFSFRPPMYFYTYPFQYNNCKIGFVLGGLGVGEAPSARKEVMKAMLDKLPAEKPRMVIGPGSPGKKRNRRTREEEQRVKQGKKRINFICRGDSGPCRARGRFIFYSVSIFLFIFVLLYVIFILLLICFSFQHIFTFLLSFVSHSNIFLDNHFVFVFCAIKYLTYIFCILN